MRYLKISDDAVFFKGDISKQDLIDVKSGRCRWLIDTKTGTYFNAEKNDWLPLVRI